MYHEPSQDEKLDNFMKVIEQSLQNNIPLYEIMPEFFKEYYNLLLILKKRINEIISS